MVDGTPSDVSLRREAAATETEASVSLPTAETPESRLSEFSASTQRLETVRVYPRRAMRRRFFLRALLWVPILALLILQFAEARRAARGQMGIYLEQKISGLVILEVYAESPAEEVGILAGDRLVGIDGKAVATFDEFARAAGDLAARDQVSLDLARGDEMLAVELSPGMAVDWRPSLLNALLVLAYLVIGLLSVVKRPGFLPADLVFWMVFFSALEIAAPSALISAPRLAVLVMTGTYLLTGIQFATEMHLVSLLPQRPAWLRRRPWIVPGYYVFGMSLAVVGAATWWIEEVIGNDLFPWSIRQYDVFVLNPGILVWATLIFGILLHSTLTYPSARGRRQAGIFLLGVLPWVLYSYLIEIFGRFGIAYPSWVDFYWSATLLPLPVAILVIFWIESGVRNRVLLQLIDQVEAAGSMEKISQLISHDLDLAFHTRRNYVFFRGVDQELTSIHSSGAGYHVERIADDFEILARIERSGEIHVYPGDWAASLPVEERDWLGRLRAQLIVPLQGSDRALQGLLLLGRKASEEPYTPSDLDLLRGLARQIALAYENIGLHVQMRERERVQRQVLQRLEGEKKIELTRDCPVCGLCFGSGVETCPQDDTPLTMSLPVERLIAERYRLEKVIGRGGVAVVYLASDLHLGRRVAIKVLAGSVIGDSQSILRFEREARVAAQLIHPNIVVTHDFGETASGCPFIVMEHLEGKSLRQALKRLGRLEPMVVAAWFGQILDGLGEAHRRRVVHRDMKPDNVMITRAENGSEQVKLLDFGLAKLLERPGEAAAHFTTPGTIMGTLAYMSPEQLSGDDVDERCDLFIPSSGGISIFPPTRCNYSNSR